MGSRSLFYGNLPLKKSWDYQVRGCGQAHGVRPPWAWPGLDVAAGTDRDWPDEGMGVCLGGHLCVVAGVSPLRPKLGARLAFPHCIVVTFQCQGADSTAIGVCSWYKVMILCAVR